MKYQIVSHHLPAALAKAIELMIADGWEPLGGIAVAGPEYHQAMIWRPKKQK